MLHFCHSLLLFRVTYCLCHVLNFFQTYFWSHQRTVGYLGDSRLTAQTVLQIWLSSHIMLLTWDSGNLHLVAVTFFSSPDPMCPLQYPPPWTATVSCISCKQAFGGGGVSTRLDASSPGMTWQWPQSAWHQNSLMGHTLSTTSAHSTRPTPSATMCSRWFPHHS